MERPYLMFSAFIQVGLFVHDAVTHSFILEFCRLTYMNAEHQQMHYCIK